MLNLTANPHEILLIQVSELSKPEARTSIIAERGSSSNLDIDRTITPSLTKTAEKQTSFIPAEGLERIDELGLLSAALVSKAESGASPAHEFRIQARMYRELLRQVMLNDRKIHQQNQLPQDLLLEMVRMSALLHSAADCKTGFVITCPADLMLQLKSQQARVDQLLKMTRMMRE